jgi:hypothetical protein
MTHPTLRRLLLAALAVVLSLCALTPCRGQYLPPAALPPAAAAVPPPDSAATEELPPPNPVLAPPPPFVLPPPPNYSAIDEGSIDSPLLDPPDFAPPGWFFNVESSVLWGNFQNQLTGGQVTLAQTSGVSTASSIGLPPGAGMPITGDLVRLPSNRFNPTVSPRFEFGYRLPDGWGELRLGYRFLDSSASASIVLPQLGSATQNARLSLQFVDLDYATREFALLSGWELRTAVGLRGATVFFDSQAAFLEPTAIQEIPYGLAPFTRLSEYEALNNWFIGAHAVLEVGRKLGASGFTFFGRAEGSGLFGRSTQTFSETFVEAPGSTSTRVGGNLGAPILAGQVGLSCEVPQWHHSRFLIGYQYEAFWQLGRGNDDLSFGTLTFQGLFLRAEFNF